VSTGGTRLELRRCAMVEGALGRRRGECREVAVVPPRRDLDAQVEAADALVGGQDVADLLPRIVHVGLRIRLDDVGAESGRDAEARVEVQPVHPVLRVGHGRPVSFGE
jgi:hypothetical protein